MEIKTDKVEKYLEYATTFIEKGKYQKALFFLKKIKVVNPAEYRVYKEMGLMNFHRGRFQEAISNYQRAVELNKDDAELYYRLGCAYYYSGQIDTSIKYFERTLEVNPNFAQALYNLGLAWEIKKDSYKAFELMQKAMKVQDDVKEIVLIPKFLDKKEGEITLDEITESIKISGKNFILSKIKDIQIQLSFLKTKKEEKFKIYFEQGKKLQAEERWGEAIKYLERARKVNPDSCDVILEKGKAFYSLNKMDSAQEELKKVLKEDEYHPEANYYLGCTYQARGGIQKAIPVFKKIISFHPNYALAYYNLAVCYEKANDLKNSYFYMEKAVELNPQVKELIPQVIEQEHMRLHQIKAYQERGFLFALLHFSYLALLNSLVYLIDAIKELLYAKEKYEKVYIYLDKVKNKLKNYINKVE